MGTCCPSMEEILLANLEIYISFDSKYNHFFQMFKTNARKGFFADISVFFAVKWPLKHNHQAASSHCLWFKSYCSSRENSKCCLDTLQWTLGSVDWCQGGPVSLVRNAIYTHIAWFFVCVLLRYSTKRWWRMSFVLLLLMTTRIHSCVVVVEVVMWTLILHSI